MDPLLYTGPLPDEPTEAKCKCGLVLMERGISVYLDLDSVLHRREGCGDRVSE